MAIAEQTKETARAARAAQESAKVARENTTAMMDSTRAWITVEAEEWRPRLQVFDKRVGREYQRQSLTVNIKNRGQTIARVVKASLNYVWTDQDFTTLPAEPHYDWTTSFEMVLPPDHMAPKAYFAQTAFLEPSEFIEQGQYDKLLAGEAILFAYGCVVYKTIHDQECEARYAFRVSVSEKRLDVPRVLAWVFGGPPAYNRHT
jgi:hypothetical protein